MTGKPMEKGGVIQFAKAPAPGKVKTRMQPVLSPDEAVALHKALCMHTVDNCQVGDWEYRLCVTEPDDPFWSECHERSAQALTCWPQRDGDLGQRMSSAIEQAFTLGWRWTLVIGSDCPALDATLLNDACQALSHADLVLLPALDGGYALIGMRRPLALFEGIAWGSDEVLAQTLRLAQQQKLSVHLLAPVADVDRPEDLALLSAWPSLAHFAR